MTDLAPEVILAERAVSSGRGKASLTFGSTPIADAIYEIRRVRSEAERESRNRCNVVSFPCGRKILGGRVHEVCRPEHVR